MTLPHCQSFLPYDDTPVFITSADSSCSLSTQGESAVVPSVVDDDIIFLGADFDEHYGLLMPEQSIVVRAYSDDSDDLMLAEVNPRFIVMFEPNLDFVRRLEVSVPSASFTLFVQTWHPSGISELKPRAQCTRLFYDVPIELRRGQVPRRSQERKRVVRTSDQRARCKYIEIPACDAGLKGVFIGGVSRCLCLSSTSVDREREMRSSKRLAQDSQEEGRMPARSLRAYVHFHSVHSLSARQPSADIIHNGRSSSICANFARRCLPFCTRLRLSWSLSR